MLEGLIELYESKQTVLSPEFARYLYKSYGLGYSETWVQSHESNRLHNRICAIPLVLEDNKYKADQERLKQKNAYLVCPIACRPQTYNIKDRWDISPVFKEEIITVESTEEEKQESIKAALKRMMSFIDSFITEGE